MKFSYFQNLYRPGKTDYLQSVADMPGRQSVGKSKNSKDSNKAAQVQSARKRKPSKDYHPKHIDKPNKDNHPKYIDMINTAIADLQRRNFNSTRKNILGYICSNYPNKGDRRVKFFVYKALKSGVNNNVWTVITFVGRARIYTPIEGATKNKFLAALNVAKRNDIDLLAVGK